MKLATTTGDFWGYCRNYKECVEYVCEAGFRYIDLSMYTVEKDDPLLLREDWRAYAEMLKQTAGTHGAKFVQAHSPGGNPLKMDDAYDVLLHATIRSIEVCGVLGIPNIVVHSGMLPGISKEEYFEKNLAFYKKLFPAMEKWNVNVLCENSTKVNTRDMYFTNSGEDMLSFVKYVNHPLFHTCWDTGHANLEGNQYDEILRLGKELYAVHINDNRGVRDEHLIPYMGTLNMDEIMRGLIDVGFDGYFTFESSSVLLSEAWRKKDAVKDACIAKPKLFMQKMLEKIMYDIGTHILQQYNCFEA